MGCWDESWEPQRRPFPSGFSFKSQHAMQKSFKQRRAGVPSEYQLCPALLPALSALFRGVLGALQVALRRSGRGQRGPGVDPRSPRSFRTSPHSA